jgi:hypothetical protein
MNEGEPHVDRPLLPTLGGRHLGGAGDGLRQRAFGR